RGERRGGRDRQRAEGGAAAEREAPIGSPAAGAAVSQREASAPVEELEAGLMLGHEPSEAGPEAEAAGGDEARRGRGRRRRGRRGGGERGERAGERDTGAESAELAEEPVSEEPAVAAPVEALDEAPPVTAVQTTLPFA